MEPQATAPENTGRSHASDEFEDGGLVMSPAAPLVAAGITRLVDRAIRAISRWSP